MAKLKKWEIVALEGIDLAFDSDGNVKKNLPPAVKKKAIELLYKSIDEYDAHLYWPYVKLVDLIDDENEKMKLHIRAYLKEDNIYSIKFIFKKIIKDNPNIINNYMR